MPYDSNQREWFDRWSIKHFSPSSLNAWRDNPAAYVAGYCFGLWSEKTAAAWRGTACEAFLASIFHGEPVEIALDRAKGVFEMEAQGLADDDTEKQRQLIAPICEQILAAVEEYGLRRPKASQLRLEHWIDGISVPLIGYPDFIFDGYCLDLKTTQRCPKEEASAPHAMQAAFYAKARGESEAKLLYASHTKHNLITLGEAEIEKQFADMIRLAKAVQATLSRARNPNELAEMCVPDFSHFRWSDDEFVNRVQSQIKEWR